MKNNIQNIFIDLKSFEKIRDKSDSENVIEKVLKGIEMNELKLQKIIIHGIEFEAEFHIRNDYFGFTYTKIGYHCICYEKNKFKNSVYLYSKDAMEEYEKDFSGETLLLYTTKKELYVIPHGANDLSKIDTSNGKLTQRL